MEVSSGELFVIFQSQIGLIYIINPWFLLLSTQFDFHVDVRVHIKTIVYRSVDKWKLLSFDTEISIYE